MDGAMIPLVFAQIVGDQLETTETPQVDVSGPQ